jgi:hypothetical protein
MSREKHLFGILARLGKPKQATGFSGLNSVLGSLRGDRLRLLAGASTVQ